MPPPIFDNDALARHLAEWSMTAADDAPTVAPPPTAGFPWGPAAATIAGNAADALSTYQALNRANTHESNPLLGQNPAGIVALKAALTIPEVWAEQRLTKAGHPTIAKVLGYGAGALGGLLAIHNSKVGK